MSRDGYHRPVLPQPQRMTKPNEDRRVHHLSVEDKEWVLRRLKDRGMSRAALGKAIGMTRQGVFSRTSLYFGATLRNSYKQDKDLPTRPEKYARHAGVLHS